ncbi:MAG: anthranilate synthase component I [Eubacterium sp.]|nr:anthranilate synthase component I [Eubacterium sp.]
MKRIRRAYSKTVSIIQETAVEIYENFVGTGTGFLLESYDKNYDRYVFMGKDPEEIIRTRDDSLLILRKDGSHLNLSGNPLELLKGYYNDFEIRHEGSPLAFSGGLVGALGYDFVRYQEDLPDENPDEIGIDTIQLMLVTEFLSLDHVAETMTAVVIEEDNEEGRIRADRRLIEMLDEALGNGRTERNLPRIQSESSQLPDDEKVRSRIIKESDSKEDYCRKVEKIKEYIVEGHVFQTVLSQRWTVETSQDGFSLYKKLRKINPSPYMYYFKFEDFEIIGSSPEMLAKHRDKLVRTCPIAGTRPRGKNEAEDAAFAASLLADPKEKAEHVMLVDLARNDMGRIAEFGSVKVQDFMHIQRYSHVMHLVSYVEGRKKEEYQPIDLIYSFLPAGTLSGAPKVRAMEIIDELEEVRRGLYGGAIGYIDFNGNMDFCITIRTMIKKGNKVYLQAGAGIVADSDPESEYKECQNKVRALARVLVEEENI